MNEIKKYESNLINECDIKVEVSRDVTDRTRYETVKITHIPSKAEALVTTNDSQINAYNQALRRLEECVKNEMLVNALADMLFAYTNKDEEFPHNFEIKAINGAVEILQAEYKGDKYDKAFFEKAKLERLY